MNTLLLFFALPLAVIILSIALQKILQNSFLVSAIIFAVFIVVTFLVDDTQIFLIATIVYTILAFATTFIYRLICRLINSIDDSEGEEKEKCNKNYTNSTGLNISDTINVDSDSIDIYPNNNSGRDSYYRYCRNYRKR